jgi:glycosyltransferase involved in cell wall biosynthesis
VYSTKVLGDKTKPIEFLFISSSRGGGGAENAINKLSHELELLNLSTGVLNINKFDAGSGHATSNTFEVNRNHGAGLLRTLKSFVRFYLLIKDVKPRVMILNCDLPELFGSLLPKRVKMIVVEHSTQPWQTRRKIGLFVRKILSLRKVSFVSVGDHIKIWPHQRDPDMSIPNLINDDIISILTTETSQRKKMTKIRRLVYVGRLSNHLKQVDWVPQIAQLTGLPATFIGDGPAEKSLQEFCTQNGLECSFEGFLINPWSQFHEGDLLVVPSSAEGDPLVVIEALHLRIPILVRKSPGLAHFGLPPINYCVSVDDFASRIIENRNQIENLCQYRTEDILGHRDKSKILEKWKKFLLNE